VGVPRTPFFENLDPEVAQAVASALDVIRTLVAAMPAMSLPPSPGLGIAGAEIYAYHAPWITASPELYQAPTRRIVQGGANAAADAYIEDRRTVTLARREIVSVFDAIDLIVMPTTGGLAGLVPPPAGVPAGGNAPGGGGPSGFRNTSYFSYYGLPAISIPCGFTADGLPIGLEIAGAPFAEATVFALAHAYEQATQWHERRPDLPG
jgi:aspartyl-tRNA(Asn)/glutamyl-tRNA(Gln) amidotransferase subunit A